MDNTIEAARDRILRELKHYRVIQTIMRCKISGRGRTASVSNIKETENPRDPTGRYGRVSLFARAHGFAWLGSLLGSRKLPGRESGAT
ncbi:MAG: hypothetical protein LBK41_09840 [Clostridiales bacterium]|jgi:hypothetical protein|nr:hypothetical protein [Clostridiales bacterium]